MDQAATKILQNDSPRVLIVRPSALGDVARTVPALATLRARWPKARIDWLVADASVDAIAHHPMLDGVVQFKRQAMRRMAWRPGAMRVGLDLLRDLRKPGYDLVYDLQGLARSGLLTRLTGAARRVGFAQARELGWLGYNVKHRVRGRVHAVEQMLGLLEEDGLEPVRDMRLYVGQADQQWRDDFFEQRGIDADDYLCIAPTARWPSKCWPIDRYRALSERLLSERIAGRDVVVFSSPSERGQVQPLLEGLNPEHRRRVHFPRTSVGQMMALLERSRVLIGNDSAALHIAVGLNRPVVALFGPTDPALVGPYRRQDAVVRPAEADAEGRGGYRHRRDQNLIARIGVERVWQAVTEQLERDARKATG